MNPADYINMLARQSFQTMKHTAYSWFCLLNCEKLLVKHLIKLLELTHRPNNALRRLCWPSIILEIFPELRVISLSISPDPETATLGNSQRDSWRQTCCQELAVTLLLLADSQWVRNALPVVQEMRSEMALPLPAPGSEPFVKKLSHDLDSTPTSLNE